MEDDRETKWISYRIRSAIEWRIKVRMIIFYVFVSFLLVFFPLLFLTQVYIPSYSIIISVPLTILILSFLGIFYYRKMLIKAKEEEKDWKKKIDEEQREIKEIILKEKK